MTPESRETGDVIWSHDHAGPPLTVGALRDLIAELPASMQVDGMHDTGYAFPIDEIHIEGDVMRIGEGPYRGRT